MLNLFYTLLNLLFCQMSVSLEHEKTINIDHSCIVLTTNMPQSIYTISTHIQSLLLLLLLLLLCCVYPWFDISFSFSHFDKCVPIFIMNVGYLTLQSNQVFFKLFQARHISSIQDQISCTRGSIFICGSKPL